MHNWANFCDIIKIDKNNKNLVASLAARFFLNDNSLLQLKGKKVYVVPPDTDMNREYIVKEAKLVGKNNSQIQLSFNEEMPPDASVLIGKSLLIDNNIAKQVFDEDSSFGTELIGLKVKDERHGDLGKIVDVAGTSVQKHLVVKNSNGEILIPFVNEIIKSQNDHELVVELPEGLLELNEA